MQFLLYGYIILVVHKIEKVAENKRGKKDLFPKFVNKEIVGYFLH